jgi:DNA primase
MDFVEQLKSSIDIVHVVGEYVRLRKAGANRYMGLCPFHTEKSPSFSVHQGIQIYKCFGCGVGGDVLKFVQEMERLTFPETLKLLAERAGIPMPKREEYNDPESRMRDALYAMNEIAANLFQENLLGSSGTDARTYLAKRGVQKNSAEHFNIGYSDRSGQQITRRLQQGGYTPEQLEASGLVMRRDSGGFYDRFRGRLMFPIHNESGKVIGFGGRALAAEEEPKYLNSPETAVYRKSFLLYNLHRAKDTIRKRDVTVLVEGYMDAIGVYTAGIHNVVASCGTALTPAQVKAMKRHSDRIVVNFDPDNAGGNATERSIEMLLTEGMHVRVLELDGGLDPDEYVKRFGAEEYTARLEKAAGYFLWLADRARRKFDMRSAEGRMEGFKFLKPAIAHISDRLERASVANEVAEYLGVERGLILEEFRKSSKREPAQRPERQQSIPKPERIILRSLVSGPEVRGILIEKLSVSTVARRFITWPVLEAIFGLHPENPSWGFSDLEARLGQSDRNLLNSAVLADNSEETFTPDQALSYAGVLAAEELQAQVSELRNRLKDAERAGDMNEAFRLMEQMNQLRRK